VKRVLVVGSGVAGVAAALAARARGAQVTLVGTRPGATVLAPGALDDAPWESCAGSLPERLPLPAPALGVLDALGAYAVKGSGVLLATTAGLVRPARGADRALLDLASLPPGPVLVPRFDHPGYDARWLARAWSDSGIAKARSLGFVAEPAQLTRYVDEHSLPDADLAARHDDPARLAWLAGRLVEALRVTPRPLAIVLPAWLGVDLSRAQDLSEQVGVPCGEALTGTGGPSGLRFERARDRALAKAGVEVVAGHVVRAEHGGRSAEAVEWLVSLESGELVVSDAVVLATGGLLGGGLEYTPAGSVLSAALPPGPRSIARATIDAPLALFAFRKPLETPSSLQGSPAESHTWPFAEDPLLDRVGVRADEDGRAFGAPPGLHVAGELVADLPRTWLAALTSGAHAGVAAAED